MISPALLNIVKLKDFPPQATKFFHTAFHETITYREQNNIVRNDFVQVLMQARKDLVLNKNISEDGKHICGKFKKKRKQTLTLLCLNVFYFREIY